MIFNRIDEWHSITGLSEITTNDIPSDWKLIDETPLLKHDSFPANQDAVNMVTWVDDHYTYIMNQVHCFDNHAGPQLMGFVLRLDKEECDLVEYETAFELIKPPEGEGA
tara:strand:- start:368 stop:694 length:327 start_codon:yes stop_codon:yes gene_type:complete